MSRCFTFRWAVELDRSRSVLVIASAMTNFDESELLDVFDADHQQNLLPDDVLLVVPNLDAEAFLNDVADHLDSGTILRGAARLVSVYAAPYGQTGEHPGQFRHLSGPAHDWPTDAFEQMKTAGLKEIFHRGKVLVRPIAGMHFVHPKGVHSLSFMRAGNAFVGGAETSFFAMTMLRYLSDEHDHIWLDTSSIASVAYAMLSLKQMFSAGFKPPYIDSFSSYEGLKAERIKEARRSLFLISATATGDLARKVMQDFKVGKENVVNLFSAAPRPDDICVHCDMHEDQSIRGASGRSLLDVEQPETCQWCADNMKLIRFVSDQFLADAVRYEARAIAESDAPSNLKPFFAQFSGHKAIGLARRGDAHRLFIDFSAFHEASFDDKVEAAVHRYVPLSVSHVVHLDDKDSKWLAGRIVKVISDTLGKDVPLVPSGEAANITPDDAKCCVVVAGCIGSGATLQVVSRDLRDVLQDSPRIYIVGVVKQGREERLKPLRSDLAHNKSYKHEFVALHTVSLPETTLSAWVDEKRFLTRLDDENHGPDVKAFIEKRIDELAPERIGLGRDLFLRSPTDAELRLSDGFAFWKASYVPDAISHGDVLATMAAVLHHMRRHRPEGKADPKLEYNVFHSTVIAPTAFGRFNDGVIQASILRAANAHELNYGPMPDHSDAMRRIIERMLERWAESQGEACLEFLLAMATKRLLLAESDRAKLQVVRFKAEPGPVVRVLLDSATAR